MHSIDDIIDSVVNGEETMTNVEPINTSPESSLSVEKLWCVCRKPSSGDMIGCENLECETEWFHFECLNIRKAPKGAWFCPNCRQGNISSKRKLTFDDGKIQKKTRTNIKRTKSPECENMLSIS